MIAAGYLLKRVVPPPAWLTTAPTNIDLVCSVSACVNDNIVDPLTSWQHNSFGLANSPEVLWDLVRAEERDATHAKLFFYTAYEFSLESDGWSFDASAWQPRTPDPSANVPDAVATPAASETLTLLGYDVVVVDYGTFHSPLSCNGIAGELPVNRYCLFDAFDEAKSAIDLGRFGGGCEEGDYTVFAVHEVAQ